MLFIKNRFQHSFFWSTRWQWAVLSVEKVFGDLEEDSTAFLSSLSLWQTHSPRKKGRTHPLGPREVNGGIVSPERRGMLHTCIIASLSMSPPPSPPKYFKMTNILPNDIKEHNSETLSCVFLWSCSDFVFRNWLNQSRKKLARGGEVSNPGTKTQQKKMLFGSWGMIL